MSDNQEVPFYYTSKASRSERDLGCEHLFWKQEDNEWIRIEEDEYKQLEKDGERVTQGAVHPCLHPEELVMTIDGYTPISELQKGDKVYTQDGSFHPVEHVSSHAYTSKYLYEISIRGTNLTTRASDNHPFLIWRPERTESGRFTRKANPNHEVLWLRADQVQKGDYTMTPILDVDEDDKYPDLCEDFWFLFGLYLAEGVLQSAGHGDNCYPSYSLHEDEIYLEKKIQAYFEPEVKVSTYPKKHCKGIQVMAFDPEVGDLFLLLGSKLAATKRLHPCIWALPKTKQKSILEGYMAGDGGDVRTYRQSKTVSPFLASQIRLLAESLGYKVNLFQYEPTEGSGIDDRKFQTVQREYHTRFYSDDINSIADGRKPSKPTYIEHEGNTFMLRHVQSVKEIPYVGDVVNLSVQGSPTFQTAVGMSHNTVKPTEIMEWLVERLSEPGDLILDPFAGSGTTGIAAMKTGRSCDLVELNETGIYKDIIEGRLHGNKVSLMENPQYADRFVIELSGELSEKHPAQLDNEISFGDIFGLG